MLRGLRLWWYLRQLRSDDETDRTRAAWALGHLGDLRAVEALVAVVTDKEGRYSRYSDVPGVAAWALGQLGDLRAVEPLIAALSDDEKSRGLQAAAAKALGELGDLSAVGPLIAALRHSWDSYLRSPAATALGRLGDIRAVGPLITALRDEDRLVRQSAAWALGRFAAASPEVLRPHWAQVKAMVVVPHRDVVYLPSTGDAPGPLPPNAHIDTGIGKDFPDPPAPAGQSQPLDF